MKLVIKVFAILGIIGGVFGTFYLLLLGLFAISGNEMIVDIIVKENPEMPKEQLDALIKMVGVLFLFGSLFTIAGVVTSALSLKKVSVAQSKNELLILAIIQIVLGYLVCGVLMLLIKDEDLCEKKQSL